MPINGEEVESLRNTRFIVENVLSQFDGFLREIQEKVNYNGLSISDHDIKNLHDVETNALKNVASAFERMIKQAELRRHNLYSVASNSKIISVGEDCFSRSILTRWGLKPSAELGERSSPFDLAVHPIAAVRSIIASNFSSYMNLENLYFSESENVVRDRHYGIVFNHESGIEYAENEFAELRAIYGRRVDNFRAEMANCERVVLLCHIQNPQHTSKELDDNMNGLLIALNAAWPGKNIRLISINTWPSGISIAEQIKGTPNFGIDIINVNYPYENYVWHHPKDFMSPQGYNFERRLIDEIVMMLQ